MLTELPTSSITGSIMSDMPSEQELYAELSQLVKERESTIKAAKLAISEANKHFDDEATRIGRLLRRYHKEDEERPASIAKSRKSVDTSSLAGLSQEEKEYYQQLKASK